MFHLHIDVLALIIDNVDNAGTLFSLLTVNKQVFHLACRALYHDPGLILHSMEDNSLEYASLAFVRLILAISPVIDRDIIRLRQLFHLAPTRSRPMLDYLSLVRVVRWEDTIVDCVYYVREQFTTKEWLSQHLPATVNGTALFMKHCLTRALCHHQLGNIFELEIQPHAIEEYIHLAPELSCLRRIFIADDTESQYSDILPLTVALVKAIQLHHGQDLLQSCFTPEIPTGTTNVSLTHQIQLDGLLPPPEALKHFHPEPALPIDRYLAKLDGLSAWQETEAWQQVRHHCPGLPSGQIIRRCRALKYLFINFIDTVDDADTIAWATEEAYDRAAGRTLAPAVPLEHLWLSFETFSTDTRAARKIVGDAMSGFTESLSTLEVDFKLSYGVQEYSLAENEGALLSHPTEGEGTLILPQLENVNFNSEDPSLFDLRLLQSTPNLARLELSLGQLSGPYSLSKGWPAAHYPNLTTLSLNGVATNSFDPSTFVNMPSLESLSLLQVPEDLSPDLASRLKRWTWDWYLPRLLTLTVQTAMDGWFGLKILRSCPMLRKLEIKSLEKHWLNVQADLDDCSRDCFKQLKELKLDGKWEITPEDLTYLLCHVLPQILVVDLGMSGTITSHHMLGAVRDHPTLRRVKLASHMLSMAECEEIGLCRAGKVIVGDICIVNILGFDYCFKSSNRTAR